MFSTDFLFLFGHDDIAVGLRSCTMTAAEESYHIRCVAKTVFVGKLGN